MTDLSFVTSFKIGDVEYASQLDEDLHIDKSDLTNAYAEHAKRFAWYATAFELAEVHEAKAKVTLERAYAILDQQARVNLEASGKKATEKMVENVVITSDDYKKFQEIYFEAQKNTGLLKAARDAMIHRKEMLVSLGATYRAEINADTSLLANQAKQTLKK